MVDYVVNYRPINGEDFKSFLSNLKTKCLSIGISNPIFFMDNTRIHYYSGVKEIIESQNLSILYLPTYSPFLNPIENCFSKWKNSVKRGNATSETELFGLINSGFSSINMDDCDGYFRNI